jgi:very-short-patch-repair endonuclease
MAVNASVDVAARRLAATQHEAVTWKQLRRVGHTRSGVKARLERGHLYRLYYGVYSVVDPALHPLVAEAGALLAIGPGAALSHRSAAAVWGIGTRSDDQVDVTVAARHPRQRAGIRIHRVAVLDPTELRTREGLLVTSPARTVCDLPATEPRKDVERALEEAIVTRLTTERKVEAVLERHGNRPGSAVMGAILQSQRGAGFTRSAAERALLKLIVAAHLPRPEKNVRVSGHVVDFLWRAERLIVEVDGYQFHGHRAAFERDRRRDQELRAAGYSVIRITWRALQEEPFGVVADLTRALARVA